MIMKSTTTPAIAKIVLSKFNKLLDESAREAVKIALSNQKKKVTFNKIADYFDCSSHSVCLVHSRKVQRNGKKVNVISFWNAFNQAFIDKVKSYNGARFDYNFTKSWSLPVPDGADRFDIPSDLLDMHKVVVDLDDCSIYLNPDPDPRRESVTAAFYPLMADVCITKSAMINAIRQERSETPIGDRIYIHNGSRFERLDDFKIYTSLPFILLRYSVERGRPRYASLSSLGLHVEELSFGGGRDSRKAIARYMDTLNELRLPGFVLNNELPTAHTREQLGEIHGFNAQSEYLERMRRRLPDINIIPLCSDYVSLVEAGLGADIGASRTYAYVITSEKHRQYLTSIGKFFGYGEPGYPIVFSRDVVTGSHPTCRFDLTLIHELSHWLVKEAAHDSINSHGVAWVLCYDILCYALLDEFESSEYFFYHQLYVPEFEADAVSAAIDDAMWNYTIPLINKTFPTRIFLKSNILDIINQTMDRLIQKGAIVIENAFVRPRGVDITLERS